eukprot:TRINITY_DN4911_c0_g1_i1.p1 TRINITY_DN4911_c0_g1~~TRINITY_DN4911_c0_g1_i1.p1  ORF type:complete len:270 (+),score=21.86 TRINITY_DN4911_c0_g1_i1:84-893(+)
MRASNLFQPLVIFCIVVNLFFIAKIKLLEESPNQQIKTLLPNLPFKPTVPKKATLDLFVLLDANQYRMTNLDFYDPRIRVHDFRCGVPISSYNNVTIDCDDNNHWTKSCLLFNQFTNNTSSHFFGRIVQYVTINEYFLLRVLDHLDKLDSKDPDQHYALGKVWRFQENDQFFLADQLYFTNHFSKCEPSQNDTRSIWQGRLDKYNVIDLSPYYFGNFYTANYWFSHYCKWILLDTLHYEPYIYLANPLETVKHEEYATCIERHSKLDYL